MTLCPRFAFTLAATAVCSLAPLSGLRAADEAEAAKPATEDAALKEEIAFITALVEANMPDFAEPVIAAAKKKWPNAGPKLKVLEMQGDLRLGKFANVQKVVDSLKGKKGSEGEYWALRLKMAEAYYSRGMMKECRAIFQDFFKTIQKPGPDLIDFYVESGFKWAQMCVLEKNNDEAVKMYGELLAKMPESGDEETENRWCSVAMQDVELLIRLASEMEIDPKDKNAKALTEKRNGYLAQATRLVDKLLWKNEMIIVFGKAIAMKAHIEMLRGNLEKAQSLVNDYMQQLSDIHRNLVEQDPDGKKGYVRMSPMPECRYLLATVLWEAVQAELKKPKANDAMILDSLFGAKQNGKRNGSGAYNHVINVFVKYPESTWAGSAGMLADEIEKFVQTRFPKANLKKQITPAQMETVRRKQFENAFEIFRDNNFAEALKVYTSLIAQFPNAEEVAGAVAVIANCNLELWQNEKDAQKKQEFRTAANAAEEELAAKYAETNDARSRAAGDELLRLAVKEREMGQLARSQQLYDLYFKKFTSHYNAAQTALSLAGKAYSQEDWAQAVHYYGIVVENFTNSTHYASALQYLSICNGKLGNQPEQEKWLRAFSKVAKKPLDRTTSMLALAFMQQKRGFADFVAASETNETDRAAIQKAATISVIKAIQDFRGVAKEATAALEDKSVAKEDRAKFENQREQSLYLEGDSWQRLQMPVGKMTLETFHANAVKAYEQYLTVYPKGKFAPQALVKIGTIHTADKKMDEAQKALGRLQSDFPDSDEAKNSVPRLAKTLIDMGLKAEGVEQYKQMLSAGGKYTAGQYLMAANALLEAKTWDVASEAYAKVISMTNGVSYVAPSLLGQAKALYGQQNYAEARQKLDDFIEKYAKSALVVDAYEMLVEVASEEGRKEKDDNLRMKTFNAAVGALKKLRGFRKTKAETDLLDLRSGDVYVRKMDAEETMGLKEKARETCGQAIVTFQAFLMANEPNAAHPAKDMTPVQLANLERCYSTVLPLMAKLGKEQSEKIIEYANVYLELFPEGKGKLAVQNALNQAKADQ